MKILRAAVLLVWLPWLASPAVAQLLVDPTRPPANLGDAAGAEVASGPVLQSVMLAPGRRVAVISGTTVVLGGRYGAATLVRVSESEAVLKSGVETTVLKLYPRVEKRATRGARSRTTGKRATRK